MFDLLDSWLEIGCEFVKKNLVTINSKRANCEMEKIN